MAQVINTNTMSLNAQRNLSTSGTNLATTIQRLSSGLRINSAKDDAAGLAISERFSTQIRGANQAARNANDGISLAQTAEGALGEIGNNLQRMRELAVQSRSATNSPSDRQALNSEVQLLKQEIQRVAEQTNFNGTSLLDGKFTNQAFQIGANQGQTINISQIANANISKLGSWTSASTDASISGTVPAGQKPTNSGSFGAFTPSDATATGALTISVGDEDIVSIATLTAASAADVQTQIDAAADDLDAAGISVSGKVADGTLAFARKDGTALEVELSDRAAASFGNGAAVNKTHEAGAGSTGVTFGAASFTLTGKTGTATIELPATGASTSGERATQLANAVNANTHKTGVSASLVEGELQLSSKEGNITIGEAAGTDTDTLLKQTGLAASTSTNYAAGGAKTGFADLDISSVGGADNAILAMDAALNSVNSSRADLGAIQNRFTSVVANLNTSSENMSAARSRIRDVDYASETAELTRNQILQQAGTAMLAQANQSSQSVLSLLG